MIGEQLNFYRMSFNKCWVSNKPRTIDAQIKIGAATQDAALIRNRPQINGN